MTTFVEAMKKETNKTTTTNGMRAFVSTTDKNVDLFFKIGASRGKDIIPEFTAAFVENKELALRNVLWSRDVREGAGERQLFRTILAHLEKTDEESAKALMNRTLDLGRTDDLFVVQTPALKLHAFEILKRELNAGNKLVGKWLPREKSAKSALATEFRKFLGVTPKEYRKLLVANTEVVETKMANKEWDTINFSHVPSQASSIYKRAFNRNTTKYGEYVEALKNHTTIDGKEVKVNANAIYPYQVIKNVDSRVDSTEADFIVAQWDALPDYIGDAKILPLVDVSGSMSAPVSGVNMSCMDMAVALGLYLADKNKGAFKDTFITFHESPKLLHLQGNVIEKMTQMVRSPWGGSTDLEAAFNEILKVAIDGNVPQSEMPEYMVILSDMQFDQAQRGKKDTAFKMIKSKFKDAGYELPKIIFWNLNAHDNVPVKAHKDGAALVSGFSPSLMKAVLSANTEDFTPKSIMLETIMQDRYAV